MQPCRPPALLLLLLAALARGQEAAASGSLSAYFGTKSRYAEVNPHLLRDPLAPPASGQLLPAAACAPLQLRALARHGTRFPTRKQILRLGQLHRRLRAAPAPCPAAQRLAAWDLWYRPDMDGRLAEQGRRDMEHLARRLAARFPALISPRRRAAFLSSSKHRCVESSAAFRQGLPPAPGEGALPRWGPLLAPAFPRAPSSTLPTAPSPCCGGTVGWGLWRWDIRAMLEVMSPPPTLFGCRDPGLGALVRAWS